MLFWLSIPLQATAGSMILTVNFPPVPDTVSYKVVRRHALPRDLQALSDEYYATSLNDVDKIDEDLR